MIRKYPDLAVATQKDMGADEEWGWLLKQDRKASPSVIPFPVFRFITPYAADSVCCQPRKLYWEEIPYFRIFQNCLILPNVFPNWEGFHPDIEEK